MEKAGATALFEEEGKGSNNIGVVVNLVRLSSLTEFGTPQFVVDKLIQAEKRKVYFFSLFVTDGSLSSYIWNVSWICSCLVPEM